MMPLALLKLVPYRDWAYAALAVAALVFYNVHVHNLEVSYAAKQLRAVDAATKRAQDAARDAVTAKDEQYASDLAKVETNYETIIANSDAAHAADLKRLRQLAQNSGNANGVLEGASPAGSSAGQGSPGSASLGFVPAELGAQLVDALRATRDQRDVCYAERDSLTGK